MRKLTLVGKATKESEPSIGRRLRLLADEVWDRGDKELSSYLHDCARKEELNEIVL